MNLDSKRLSYDTTNPHDHIPDLTNVNLGALSLCEIFNLCGTDKGQVGNAHRYDVGYEKIFNNLPKQFMMAEIGVACGASLRSFSYYRPQALIHGYDIRTECIKLCKDLTNVEIFIRDAVSNGVLSNYDLIIDDASHISEDIVKSFQLNWKNVNPGGFYVVEDLACVGSDVYTSQHNSIFGRTTNNSRVLFTDFVGSLLQAVDSKKCIESILYLPEIIIIQKRAISASYSL